MSVFISRIRWLQEALSRQQVDAVLVEDPLDLYYFTGLHLTAGQLVVEKEKALLFVDPRYQEMAEKQNVVAIEHLSDEKVSMFIQSNGIRSLAFDGDKTSFHKAEILQKRLTNVQCISWNNLTKTRRVIKDNIEIALLRDSANLLWEGFRYIKEQLQEGITEKELSLLFTLFCLERGGEKLSFEPIIAFGENSAMPHYRAGNRPLRRGDVVLIDVGIEKNHYHSDMTRVLFFGKEDPLLSQWLAITKKAQAAALSLCYPGQSCGAIDSAARAVFAEEGLEEYFTHSLGHGIGLEVHEFPRIRSGGVDASVIIEPGMVFTVEPGLYKKGMGGVRYEDTIIITETGYQNLTPLPE